MASGTPWAPFPLDYSAGNNDDADSESKEEEMIDNSVYPQKEHVSVSRNRSGGVVVSS